MQRGTATPEEYLELFKTKVYEQRDSDKLRQKLLEYGDISIYDNGGSWNMEKVWMERRCMLRNDRDETYWNKFMNGNKANENATIVANYLLGNTAAKVPYRLLNNIGSNLGYMTQKYYLWYEKHNERMRVVLLNAKQAAKSKARELCIQELHKQIAGSWVWEHNFCVVDFKPTANGIIAPSAGDGYYIDIWYDWFRDGGKWHCRIGHRLEGTLPKAFVNALRGRATHICDVPIEWICNDENGTKLITIKDPIYIERPDEDYFSGTEFAKRFFDELCGILKDLHTQGLMG